MHMHTCSMAHFAPVHRLTLLCTLLLRDNLAVLVRHILALLLGHSDALLLGHVHTVLHRHILAYLKETKVLVGERVGGREREIQFAY